jgi:hypothetical protein
MSRPSNGWKIIEPARSKIHVPSLSRVRQRHAGGGRLKAELPRPVCGLVRDFVESDGVFEDHAVLVP